MGNRHLPLILVSGSDGQLGCVFRKISDKWSDLFRFLFKNSSQFDITSIQNIREVLDKENPDIVINCAAYTAVDKAENDVDKCMNVNCKGAENLAIETKNRGIKLVHFSTDYVFDGTFDNPISEDEPINPLSIYGKSKAEGEKWIVTLNNNALIFRTSWLYSEFGTNFVKTILKLLKSKQRLTIIGDQFGKPTYAPDLADAVLRVLSTNRDLSNLSSIYHYANKGVTSWYDFANEIKSKTNSDCEIVKIKTEEYLQLAKRPKYSALSTELFEQQFHIDIPQWQTSLKECLKELENKA